MKQLRYILKAKHAGADDSTAWEEKVNEIVEDDMTAERHGKDLIAYFNRTLKPFEMAREFIAAIETGTTDGVEPEKVNLKHDWEKASLVTEKGGYDNYRCNRCGATGKRYGLGAHVRIDRKYKKYEFNCPHDLKK